MQQNSDTSKLKVIGANLKKLRRTKDEKIETLSKALGASTGKLSQVENGRYANLTSPFLETIARYYQVQLEELLK